jgi:hypothetical protein
MVGNYSREINGDIRKRMSKSKPNYRGLEKHIEKFHIIRDNDIHAKNHGRVEMMDICTITLKDAMLFSLYSE